MSRLFWAKIVWILVSFPQAEMCARGGTERTRMRLEAHSAGARALMDEVHDGHWWVLVCLVVVGAKEKAQKGSNGAGGRKWRKWRCGRRYAVRRRCGCEVGRVSGDRDVVFWVLVAARWGVKDSVFALRNVEGREQIVKYCCEKYFCC